tara:strand:- start:303 stop:605 length:303 start_codon:yes stop_codon:yes gene_type:complete
MATYQYCVAENWGKGFITANDSRNFSIHFFPGNVWRVDANNQDANRWITGVNGARKTLSEAQAIVDAEVTQAQSDWDALPEEVKTDATNPGRPEDITLVE